MISTLTFVYLQPVRAGSTPPSPVKHGGLGIPLTDRPDGAVVMSSGNGLVGTGFTSRYRHHTTVASKTRRPWNSSNRPARWRSGYVVGYGLAGTGFTSRYRLHTTVASKTRRPWNPSNRPAPMAQWLCRRIMGWQVLGSHLGTGSNPEQVFKDPMGRCMATTPSSLTNL